MVLVKAYHLCFQYPGVDTSKKSVASYCEMGRLLDTMIFEIYEEK